jgi:L-glyceraldehyde 3-phosphate reductase
LNEIARQRGQSLAQMAIAWVLRNNSVTTALIGASSTLQLENSYGALSNLEFNDEELKEIDVFAQDAGINIWALSSNS